MARSVGLFLLNGGADRRLVQLASVRALLEYLGHTQPTEPEPGEHQTPRGHVPTHVTDDDLILTPFGTPSRGVSDAIQRAWPHDLWTDAARVSYLESDRWSPTAERNTLAQAGGRCGVPIGSIRGHPIVSEDSVGLFQVNVCAWPYTREQMLDPIENARAGYAIYRQQGWAAWQITAETLGLV